MLVNVNMSREVFEYFKEYDLSQVADTLLEMYDFTNLPQISGPREIERKVNVSNEMYISLYNTFGPRSKKISLGRLFAFGYEMDVLRLERFRNMKIDVYNNPTLTLVDRAYRSLLDAQKYDKSAELKEVTQIVYAYREAIK